MRPPHATQLGAAPLHWCLSIKPPSHCTGTSLSVLHSVLSGLLAAHPHQSQASDTSPQPATNNNTGAIQQRGSAASTATPPQPVPLSTTSSSISITPTPHVFGTPTSNTWAFGVSSPAQPLQTELPIPSLPAPPPSAHGPSSSSSSYQSYVLGASPASYSISRRGAGYHARYAACLGALSLQSFTIQPEDSGFVYQLARLTGLQSLTIAEPLKLGEVEGGLTALTTLTGQPGKWVHAWVLLSWDAPAWRGACMERCLHGMCLHGLHLYEMECGACHAGRASPSPQDADGSKCAPCSLSFCACYHFVSGCVAAQACAHCWCPSCLASQPSLPCTSHQR